MNIHEIIRENALYPYRPLWREAIKGWQDRGYWISVKNMGSLLVIQGDESKEIQVFWTAFGIQVCPVHSEFPTVLHLLNKPDHEVIESIASLLPEVSEETRKREMDAMSQIPKHEFAWKDRARPVAVKLVSGKMKNGYTLEEAIVHTLTNIPSSVCFGYQSISLKTLTGFVSDCWSEYSPFFGIQDRQDGEIERIFAALTGLKVETVEIPAVTSVQLDLFSWFERTVI